MKFILLSFISILLLQISFAQDTQWYVKNGIGKVGSYYEGEVEDQIMIKGVKPPNLECTEGKGRNDIFIIYDDLSYYLSKDHASDKQWLKSASNYLQSNSEISFVSPNQSQMNPNSEKNVAFLYFTNIYETDDPPQSIQVSAESNTNPMEVTVSESDGYQPDVFKAHQSIVPGKDLVLIMSGHSDAKKLQIDLVRRNGGEVVSQPQVNQYFELVNNLTELEHLGVKNANLIGYSIEFQSLKDNTYSFLPIRPTINLNPELYSEVIFYNHNASLRVSVDSLHDPNFVKLISESSRENYFFYRYRVQVRNNGQGDAKDVLISLEFDYEIENLFIHEVNMGNYIRPEVVSEIGDYFIMNSNRKSNVKFCLPRADLPCCSSKIINRQPADGWIEFTIMTRKRVKCQKLFPKDSYTCFNNFPFPITSVIDARSCYGYREVSDLSREELNAHCSKRCTPNNFGARNGYVIVPDKGSRYAKEGVKNKYVRDYTSLESLAQRKKLRFKYKKRKNLFYSKDRDLNLVINKGKNSSDDKCKCPSITTSLQ